uniref:Uncharacterized protein n=1 Tax=Streptomyces sp. NBC_00180 TaxID=2903632 RepID=A0AAU1IA41_9ACTN
MTEWPWDSGDDFGFWNDTDNSSSGRQDQQAGVRTPVPGAQSLFGQSATSEEQLWNALNELGAVEEWTGQGVTEKLGNDALRVLRDVADSYGITAAGNEDLASVVVAHLAAQAAGPPANNAYAVPPTTAPPPYTSAGIGDDRQLLQWCIDNGYARSPYQQVRAGVSAQWQYETQEIDGWLLRLAARSGLSTAGADPDGLWQAIVTSSTPAADDMPAGGRGDGANDQVMTDAPAREAAAPWQWSTRDKEILLSFLNGADLDLGLAEPTLDGLQEHLDAHYAATGDGPRPAARTWLAGAFRNSTFVTEQLVPAATEAGLPAPNTEDLPAYLHQAWTQLRASRWTAPDEQTLQDFLQPYSHPQPGGPRPAPTLKTLHTYLTARLQPPPAKAGPWIHNARRYSDTAHTIINTHPDNAPSTADNATAWLTYLTHPTQPPTPAREAAAPWQWSTRDKEILLSFLNGADLDLGLAEPTLDGLQEHLDAHYAATGDGPRPAARTWLAGAFRNSTFVTEQLVPAATEAGLPAPSTEDLPAYLHQAWTLLRASRWTDADEQTLQDFLQPYSHPQPGGPRPAPTLKTLHTYLTARLQPPPAKAGPWIHNARRYSDTAHTIINTHPDNAPSTADNATAWLTYLTHPTQPPASAPAPPPPALHPQIRTWNTPQHPAPATRPDTGPPALKRRRTRSGSAPAVDLATVDPQAVQTRLDRLTDYQRWIVSGLLHGHDPAQIGTYRIYYTGPGTNDTPAPAHAITVRIRKAGEALGLSTAPDTLRNDLRVLRIQDPGTYHGAHYETLHAAQENDVTYTARANAIAADPASPHRWYLSAVLHDHTTQQITQTLQANGQRKSTTYVDRRLDLLSRALGMPAHYTADDMRAKVIELKGAITDPGVYTTTERDLDAALLDDAQIAERANRLTDDRLRLILSAALSGENIDGITRALQHTRTRGAATYRRQTIEAMLRDLGLALGLDLTANQVRLKIHSLKARITDPGTYDTTERDLGDTRHTDDTTVNNTLTLTNPLHLRTLQAALHNATVTGVQTAGGFTTLKVAYAELKSLGNALGLNDTGAGVLATIQRLRDRINTARNQN